jgi:hypothetical protein
MGGQNAPPAPLQSIQVGREGEREGGRVRGREGMREEGRRRGGGGGRRVGGGGGRPNASIA